MIPGLGRFPWRREQLFTPVLAWRIPWTVYSVGSQRARHSWVTFILTFHEYYYKFKALPFVLQSTSCMQEWKIPSTWGGGGVQSKETREYQSRGSTGRPGGESCFPLALSFQNRSFLKCRAWSRKPVFPRAALRGGRKGKDREGCEEPQSPSTCQLLGRTSWVLRIALSSCVALPLC